MMKIRMRVDVSGTRNGESWPPRGSVLEVPDAEAAAYCAAGMAEPVTVVDEPEKAVAPDMAEKRVQPADVRKWAADQGLDLPARGPIPADVLEQYKAAQG